MSYTIGSRAIIPIKMRDDFIEDPFFSSSWSRFDEDRNKMMKKQAGGDFWDAVEADMERFEAAVAAMEKEMEDRMGPQRPRLPEWAVPDNQKHNWPALSEDTQPLKGFTSQTIKDTGDSWTLEVDIGEYDSQGVKLSVCGDTIIIRAARSNLEVKPNNQSSFSTSIERRFSLPPGCNPDNLTSKITTDNILIVNCPRKMMLTGPSSRAIKTSYY